MGFLSVREEYSVAKYVVDAGCCIRDIVSRGKLPILVGGTGLYVTSLLNNITFPPEANDPDYRAVLEERAAIGGIEPLLAELAAIDPETADQLHPNNRKRIFRALEVYHATGCTMSEWNRRSRAEPSPYAPLIFGLFFRERSELYSRIDRRVDEMLENGLVNEAKLFFESSPCRTARQAIGYKELLPFLEGTAPLNDCVAALKQDTRRYAKRQLTWFRRDERVHWLDVQESSIDQLQSKAAPLIEEFLQKFPIDLQADSTAGR